MARVWDGRSGRRNAFSSDRGEGERRGWKAWHGGGYPVHRGGERRAHPRGIPGGVLRPGRDRRVRGLTARWVPTGDRPLLSYLLQLLPNVGQLLRDLDRRIGAREGRLEEERRRGRRRLGARARARPLALAERLDALVRGVALGARHAQLLLERVRARFVELRLRGRGRAGGLELAHGEVEEVACLLQLLQRKTRVFKRLERRT